MLVAGFAPLFGALTLPDGMSWLLPNVVAIVAVAALHLIAILDRVIRQEEPLTHARPDCAALVRSRACSRCSIEALQPAYPDFRGGLAAIDRARRRSGSGGMAVRSGSRGGAQRRRAGLHAGGYRRRGPIRRSPVVSRLGGRGRGGRLAGTSRSQHRLPVRRPRALGVRRAPAVRRLLRAPRRTSPRSSISRSLTTWFVVALGYAMAWMFNRSSAPQRRPDPRRAACRGQRAHHDLDHRGDPVVLGVRARAARRPICTSK